MQSSSSLARRVAAIGLFGIALGVPRHFAAQTPAISTYGTPTTDVGWQSGPGTVYGPGFTFTTSTNVFVTALSLFNPDAFGGAQGLNYFGDPSFADVFTVVLAQVSGGSTATALAWATINNASAVRSVSTGGITGAFFSTALVNPFALQAGQQYAIFAGNDQGLLTVGSGWDVDVTPPPPTTNPFITVGGFASGSVDVSSLTTASGIALTTAPDANTAFSSGASFEMAVPVTATPEPATLTMVGAGLAGLGLKARKRREAREAAVAGKAEVQCVA